ncbi:MAG: sigma-70 family RNA polymerase sigma factor [Planctomycetales bacterium]|nr:sigma-70 family RNA polymerase sigma factor [Planctomycetales bacterium]
MGETEQVLGTTDKSLLRRLRGGDGDAATALYERYAQRLIELARRKTSLTYKSRFDAEDVVQSVFRSFFRRAQEGIYDVPGSGELWQLLLVLSLNKIRRLALHHTRQKRDVRNTLTSDKLSPEFLQAETTTGLDVLRLVVDEVIGELPDFHQQIIQDRIEGHEVAEIANRVGRSKRTVERVLQQFRQMLAEVIDES